MHRRLAAASAALATVGSLLLAAPSTAGTGDTAADGPDYHRPSVGDCRQMSWQEITQASDPPATVDCSTPHSARTIAVPSLPQDVGYTDQARLERIATRACTPAEEHALGRTRLVQRQTAYQWVWFVPTTSEWDHGARWLRCDLVLLGGQAVLTLPTDRVPALPSGRLPRSVARCLVGRDAITTVCARKHQWRAVGGFVLDQKRYPTNARAVRRIERRCAGIVGAATFSWTYASKAVWAMGRHEVVCYRKTRR